MKYIIAILLSILSVSPVFAFDKKLGAINEFKIGVFDEVGNGISGRTYTTDYVVKVQCGNETTTTVDGAGDTITDLGGGYYRLLANDIITYYPSQECLTWAEGAGSYANLIAKTPSKFDIPAETICDISAATSSTSFTIANCYGPTGSAITLATDMFVGSYLVAFTGNYSSGFVNTTTACNVEGQGVFVSDLASGVVTVKTSDMPGSDFSTTPSTSNCLVGIYPTP